MSKAYIDVISSIERLHRQFLEVVKLELEGMGIYEINNVQAMILFNIGEAEMTVGELTLRGCYLGSNVSYNLRKLVEQGYLAQQRSVHDRRSVHVRLAEKGKKLRDRLTAVHRRHANMLQQAEITDGDLQDCRDHASRPRTVLEPPRSLSATVACHHRPSTAVNRRPQSHAPTRDGRRPILVSVPVVRPGRRCGGPLTAVLQINGFATTGLA
jgi:DNA-binding MarR family transcriptional regulator